MTQPSRLRRVGIVGHLGRASVRHAADRLRRRLTASGCVVRVEAALAEALGIKGSRLDDLGRWCQLLVALGGDGTALSAARALEGRTGLLFPVNLGGLGFLAAAEADEMLPAVRAALRGRFPARARRLVRASVRRRGRRVFSGSALNDAVIRCAAGFSAVHLRVRALGSDLGRLVADGLIGATATGSTAYSMSAGGPLLAPDVEALLVTPVCAHSLGTRPLVVGPSSDVEVTVLGAHDRVALLLDGHARCELKPRDEVRLGIGRWSVRIAENPDRPLARALRAKLGWQGSARRSF